MLVDDHVVVGRSNVDLAALDPLTVTRMHGRQLPAPRKDAREKTRRTRRDMNDYENAGVEIRRQFSYELNQSLDSSRRRAYDNDVSLAHLPRVRALRNEEGQPALELHIACFGSGFFVTGIANGGPPAATNTR